MSWRTVYIPYKNFIKKSANKYIFIACKYSICNNFKIYYCLINSGVADQVGSLREHLFNSVLSLLRTITFFLRKLLVAFRLQKGPTPEEIWGI